MLMSTKGCLAVVNRPFIKHLVAETD